MAKETLLPVTLELIHDGGNSLSCEPEIAFSVCKQAKQTNPSDCLRKKDASPQSSAGFPTSFSFCELSSCENFLTNFQATQAASSPSHKLELSKTMLARAASDEEVVGHIPNRQGLHIKLGGILGRLAPNDFQADAAGHLNERIQHARADALHFATGWANGVRVRRCEIQHDMMTPRSSAKTESKNRRRFVPCGTRKHHKYNLGACILLNCALDLLQRHRRSANRPVGFPSLVCKLAVFERILNVRIIT
ncbi:MAG: hypothetical protein HY298_25050 [Verrucomicrobia bacterium]|nr:hypothetical protein [Verrucomicrobiota bacterium]